MTKLVELVNGRELVRKLGPSKDSPVFPSPMLPFFACHQYTEYTVCTGLEQKKKKILSNYLV